MRHTVFFNVIEEAHVRWPRGASVLRSMDTVLERDRRFNQVSTPLKRLPSICGVSEASAEEWVRVARDATRDITVDAAVAHGQLKVQEQQDPISTGVVHIRPVTRIGTS